MDYSKYRKTGELSDLTVTVDNQKFNVHKFPLFVRSDYFKNVAASSSSATLEDFPGGASTFETIADYLYGKNVNVNAQNAVPIRCAIDYLKMNDDVEKQQQPQQRSLANIADGVLLDATQAAKAKRDYQLPLEMLDQAARAPQYAESNGMHKRLIDSFVDSLAYSQKTGSLYDSYGLYDSNKGNSPDLSKDQLEILNHLPLDWMLELIKSAQKNGLSQPALANIVKNYLDSNTGLNPHYNTEAAAEKDDKSKPKSDSKPAELISMAADILKVEKKLNDLVDDESKDEKPSSLIQMASEILGKKPGNIEEDNSKEKSEPPSSSKTEKKADEKSETKESPEKEDEKPAARKPRKPLNKDEKLKTITDVTKLLNELKLDPPFAMPWLMLYLNELNELGADDQVKSAFNRWAWDALQNSKNDPKSDASSDGELAAVPPAIMIQMAKDLAPKKDDADEANKTPKSDKDTSKFVDLIDRYLGELDKQDKLTPDTFINLNSAVPKDKRTSYDNLMQVLLNLLKKEDKKIDPETKNKLLEQIDFGKLSEKTLEDCKKSEVIPPQYIAEAALALCAKLRKELEDSKQTAKSHEYRSHNNYSPISPTQRIVPDIYTPSSNYNPRYSPNLVGPTSSSTRTRSIDPPNYTRSTYTTPAGSYSGANLPTYTSSNVPTYTSAKAPTYMPAASSFTSTGVSPNKVIYPIPVSRTDKAGASYNGTGLGSNCLSATAAAAGPSASRTPYSRDRATLGNSSSNACAASPNNHFEHTSEFYTNDQKEQNADFFYSSSYSYTANC